MSTRQIHLATAALLASLVVASGEAWLRGQARPSSGAAFTLGVLRRDGIVIPFAAHDALRWINRWPAAGRRPDIPISIADSPGSWWLNDKPVATWTVWPTRGDSRVVHVKGAVSLTVECQAQVGLLTDYASLDPSGPPAMQPYPKDGLATAGDILIEPVEILDAKSADWALVSADVAAEVTAEETKRLANHRPAQPVPEAERAKKAFTLEVLYRSRGPRPETTQLYFEGVKRYGRPPASGRFDRSAPALLTYAAGFVLIDPHARPRIDEQVTISDDRREGLVYTLALGSFRLGGALFWAVQRSGWGFERYDVLEVAEAGVRSAFETLGGRCR